MFSTKLRFAGLAALSCTLLALPALASSQARIVRLSDVQGSVVINKGTGMGFEKAFLNLPITQGAQLITRDGRAEVEFEDGSTLLLGPNTKVDFTDLSRNDAGNRVTAINIFGGPTYLNWLGKDGENFTANFAPEKIELTNPAHLRIESSQGVAKIAVFKGDVNVTTPTGNVALEKKKMAIFDENDGKSKVAKLQEEPLDNWDKESDEYHQQYAKNNSSNVSPYGYGYSDLNYYGSYQNVPGYGTMWQPYFTGVGWDPFMDGAWSFYPGMGYMFVSAYPWGWMPYRYGNWMFVPSFGWMWQPGNWNSYMMTPRYAATNLTTFHPPVAPAGTTKTVVVGRGGPAAPVLAANSSRYVVSRGSAGLGIPRGSFNNMNHLNSQVAKSGTVRLEQTPAFATTHTGRSMMAMGPYGTSGGQMGAARPASGSAPHAMATAPAAGHASAAGAGGSHH